MKPRTGPDTKSRNPHQKRPDKRDILTPQRVVQPKLLPQRRLLLSAHPQRELGNEIAGNQQMSEHEQQGDEDEQRYKARHNPPHKMTHHRFKNLAVSSQTFSAEGTTPR